VGRKNRAAFSNRDRDPYGLIGAPSARGSTGGALGAFDRQAAIADVTAPPMARNQRRDRGSGMMRTIIPAARQSAYVNEMTPPTADAPTRRRVLRH
jgi:hypothetical protein